jgi:hypothetical protein
VETSCKARRESRRGQEKAAKEKALRRMIVAELERQERGFVEVMQTLVQDYLQPLQQVNPPVISNDMMSQLSCGVREILEIHSGLLGQMEILLATWEEVEALGELSKLVTKTFSDIDVFNIYSSYVNNLAELQKNFKEEAESNQEFANFLKETSSNFGSNLDWYSLSMKPVQKLPQLKMLLERLLKKTPKDHPDRSAQRESVQVLLRLLDGINETKRELDLVELNEEQREQESEGRERGKLLSRLAGAIGIR